MKDFTSYLSEIGEIGFVEEVAHPIVYASGLPRAQPWEIILFESGQFGHVLSLGRELLEILVFSESMIPVGTKAVRTNQVFEVLVGEGLLGRIVNPLGNPIDLLGPLKRPLESRQLDVAPVGIKKRERIKRPLHTGVNIADLVVPLGKGQRELIIGDRKTGKTAFVLQALLTQARLGSVCIYAAIGKKKMAIKIVEEFMTRHNMMDRIITIASNSDEPASLIFLTPYTALTVAEYFRDKGRDVLIVLDDLLTHARFYREIALLGRRFPGRNSYPGDIFYIHAKLLERAGNFKTEKGEVSITCLPIAETTAGDLSGYIQTNLMSMTDGHLFFDSDYFAKGRRPAINPFLSVSRVGRQTQSAVLQGIQRELISFLTLLEKMQSFIHFGAELNEGIRLTMSVGEKIIAFLDQEQLRVIPLNLQAVLFCMLWSGFWQDRQASAMKQEMEKVIKAYYEDDRMQKSLDGLVLKAKTLNELLGLVQANAEGVLPRTTGVARDRVT